MPPKSTPKLAFAGEEYDTLPCPWCGAAVPLFRDKRGMPFGRCQFCWCRFFGTQLAMTVAADSGRLLPVVWPPENYDGGVPVNG